VCVCVGWGMGGDIMASEVEEEEEKKQALGYF